MAANDFGRMKLWLAGGTAFAVVYGWAWFATNAPAEDYAAVPETTPVAGAPAQSTGAATGAGGVPAATVTATATAAKPTPTPVPTRVKKSRGS